MNIRMKNKQTNKEFVFLRWQMNEECEVPFVIAVLRSSNPSMGSWMLGANPPSSPVPQTMIRENHTFSFLFSCCVIFQNKYSRYENICFSIEIVINKNGIIKTNRYQHVETKFWKFCYNHLPIQKWQEKKNSNKTEEKKWMIPTFVASIPYFSLMTVFKCW